MNQYLFFFMWYTTHGILETSTVTVELPEFTGVECIARHAGRIAELASEVSGCEVDQKQVRVTGVTKIETPQGE